MRKFYDMHGYFWRRLFSDFHAIVATLCFDIRSCSEEEILDLSIFHLYFQGAPHVSPSLRDEAVGEYWMFLSILGTKGLISHLLVKELRRGL